MAAVSRPKPTRPRTPVDAGAAGKSAARVDRPVQDEKPAEDEKRAQAKNSAPAAAAEPRAFAFDRLSRVLFMLVAAAAGVVVGGLGSFGHRSSATWLGVSWPTGLVLCFGGLVGLMLALGELPPGAPQSWRPTRLSAVSCASAGWLLALIWLTYLGPPFTFARKGDVILPNDWKSITYLLGGMALIVAAAYRAWLASLNARLTQRPGGSGGVHPRG